MDEKSDQILEHIENQRTELGANLSELETRVRRTTDWRTHFDNNPMLMVGLAFGGGMLLGSMVGSGGSRRKSSSSYSPSKSSTAKSFAGGAAAGASLAGSSSSSSAGPATSFQKQRASETLDTIKAALIAFATAKTKEFLNDALPGFDRHFTDVEKQRGSEGSNDASNQPGGGYGSGGQSTYGSGQSSYGSGSGSTGSGSTGGFGSQTSGSGQGANYGQGSGSGFDQHSGTKPSWENREEESQSYKPNY